MDWSPPDKPAELTESRLIEAIISGRFPAGSNLPGERELSTMLGITRPTLREVLQRLSRDGWIEIRQGKPTRVRDYWHEGTLAVLTTFALRADAVPADFVANLLSIRILLCPTYTRLAIERDPLDIASLLETSSSLEDNAAAYAAYDWRVHRRLTILSGNPVFTMFINSVQSLYQAVGNAYFYHPDARAHSRKFYQELRDCAIRPDACAAGELAEKIMRESAEYWEKQSKP